MPPGIGLVGGTVGTSKADVAAAVVGEGVVDLLVSAGAAIEVGTNVTAGTTVGLFVTAVRPAPLHPVVRMVNNTENRRMLFILLFCEGNAFIIS